MSEVSIILPVRDMEGVVAPMVRAASEVGSLLVSPDDASEPVATEIITLDMRSGDNTLSILSILHSQIENLRTVQDVDVGAGISRGCKLARGRVWLVMDREVDPALAGWGVSQVLRGQRAAIVPGEILAIERDVGTVVLRGFRGGLVSAQNSTVRFLRGRGERPAFSPPTDRRALHRARLMMRGGLGWLGLGRFDRPGDE